MESKRNEQVDIARGIAILCIILGHLGSSKINRFVFTFHVPIFYLIAGYYFNVGRDFRTFLRRRGSRLLVPYGIGCGMILLSALIFCLGNGGDLKGTLLYWLQAAAYGAGDSYTEPFVIHQIGGIWFLLAMLWGSLGLWVLLKSRAWIRVSVAFVLFFLLHWSTRWFWFPWSIQAGGAALLYMLTGYEIRRNEAEVRSISPEMKALLLVIALGIWLEFIIHFQGFWLVHDHFGRGAIDFIGSLCACLWILILSGMIAKVPLIGKGLAFCGRYSILILCAHITELNTFPWGEWISGLFPQVQGLGKTVLVVAGKFIWAIGVAFLLSRWKVSRKAFGLDRTGKEIGSRR